MIELLSYINNSIHVDAHIWFNNTELELVIHVIGDEEYNNVIKYIKNKKLYHEELMIKKSYEDNDNNICVCIFKYPKEGCGIKNGTIGVTYGSIEYFNNNLDLHVVYEYKDIFLV